MRNASNKGIEDVRDNSIKRVQQYTDKLVLDADARFRSAKNMATAEYKRQVKAINDEYQSSAKNTADSRGKMERFTDALAKWKAQLKDIDSEIAKLEGAHKRLKEFIPADDNTIFAQMFATSLLAASVGLGAYAGGPGGAIGGIGGGMALAAALSRPGTQRLLAGQTGIQKAGASLADILIDVNNKVEAKFGVSANRLAAQRGAQPTRDGVMFNNDVKASIRRLPAANKAQIFRSVEKAGKLEAFKAEDPGFYRELEAAAR